MWGEEAARTRLLLIQQQRQDLEIETRKLNEINTGRFKKALNEAFDKKYKYVVCELNYGNSYITDPRTF
jgi:hypothetical protein